MVRAHVIFSGTVQGVGFRYTAQRMAGSLRLTGWVKNLSDGRVELVAEGTREQIENFLYKLDKHFETRIRHKDLDWLDAKKSFSAFEIAY
ncbi:MAG: acylphosphatase [Candidatus Omnitrophica bacterium]|nr:acylphosphatase [Candidatus Omnitrophota bacterium]